MTAENQGAPEPVRTQGEPETGAAAGPRELLIVGIGASAGGLEALEELFDAMPADTGMAFVVVTHIPAGRVSLMPELLARHCSMPIVDIQGPTVVEPNHVYLAGGSPLALVGGILQPKEPIKGPARATAIDGFFRSLALDAKERAIGIVLSGTGSDGTLGVKEIKAQSGMTMAQEETSARYASMPHNAIASLHVDYVLPPREMPKRLVSYASRATRRGALTDDPVTEAPDAFTRLFLLLRTRTGHDFSSYKGTTIRRRVERRMNVHQMESMRDYLAFVQSNARELDRLFKELLIGVTSFFRDPDAHEFLSTTALPELLANKPDDHVIRAWVPGCSTGEEAYSLAIELKEAMELAKVNHAVQIFATDLDPDAIEVARAGDYPETIEADVSARRLERYFQKEDGYYRIKKEIREMLVFAPQNLIDDPPFTKLDLLSCRNLLIYFDGLLQQRLMPMFHYALRPGGILFLGSSETVGGFGHLFDAVDKKWKIFRRKEGPASPYIAEPSGVTLEPGGRETAGVAASSKAPDLGLAHGAERALIAHLVPPTIIVHERGEIVHIHGRTGMFLEPAPGPPTSANVYNMAREGLQLDLAVAIRHAAAHEQGIVHRGVRVKNNGHFVSVDLRVKRLSYPDNLRGLFLVAFEHVELVSDEPATAGEDGRRNEHVADRLAELERELQQAKDVHQSTIEELQTANEELKSTNEELQSTNEELQSANEELETSKEEMQSMNEELQTVNNELQGKVDELSRANDDMKNLLNGTDIATLFLDNGLNIKRYTEQAKRVIRLIPSDVGRPVGDLVSTLKHKALVDDATEVLRTLVFKEAEVQSEDGAWYLMRMLPYRTTENVIDGLVVTFVEITKIKGLQEEARRLVEALGISPIGIFGQDADLTYDWAFGTIMGRGAKQLVGRKEEEIFGEAAPAMVELKREAMRQGRPLRRQLSFGQGGVRKTHDVFVQPNFKAGGQVIGVSGVVTEIEEQESSS